jgi:hypothetical protein
MFLRPIALRNSFLLALLLAVTTVCHAAAQGTDIPVGTQAPLEINSPLTSGWTVADLDGDHNPDIAQTRGIGQDGPNYLYRVELKLSQAGTAASFTFSDTDSLGVNVAAIDVDGDHDLDLVISARFRHERIGVWINDGKGSFIQNSHSLFAATEDSSLCSVHDESAGPTAGDTPSRARIAYLPNAGTVNPRSFRREAFECGPSDRVFRFPYRLQHFRAPPSSSSI